ncbi:PucR family transcriptional regulator [Streptomyces sp. WI04-05B]|uniref:PucR family transcriptional regulator n=1 Tax=Streptomyces TaxID=1883 RepID=UPI0029A395B4|nr:MULTISPECIES: helix-turn-helix domain-containing protein [unclassified Streptomyces]MDX2546540.1 helix-turn-helix domain-containing protein [Streptomyces sp. WI04-05B]MDX2587828.1 helix-turn-helix domain-containing protein [Streptomyces sp. WI04-05A]MDX3751574.1 helix-turn-helix domain-containing protein [Streptomyces sp. AK08-02]
MIQTAGRSLSPVEAFCSTPEEDRVADFRAKVRAAGREWTGNEPDELVELLTRAAAGDPKLAAIVRAGGRLLQDFLDGYQQRSTTDASRDLAGDLADGRPLPADVFAGLAPRYLIAAVRLAEPGREEDALCSVSGQDTLLTHRDGNVVLFVPAGGPGSGERSVKRLTECLGGRSWLATAERDRAHLVDGFKEASCVLKLVMAGLRPSGAYTMSDVLVEYAVTLNEKVRTDLAAMIRPLRAHKVLWETLTAFVDSDYSRNKAARSMFIHRSTLDYRLRRIEDITGCDPTSGRGAQMLTAAMIAEALQG